MRTAAASLCLLSLAGPALSATYFLKDNIVGADFYKAFNFEAIADPTHGRVNYVDAATAISQNLTFAHEDTFILRADYKTTLDPNGPGRNSARIRTNKGEIDIVEGVNDQGPNAVTLHTSPGCTMPAERPETGTPTLLDCDTSVNGNAGCGVHMPGSVSYGPAFNNNGGGWYVVERTNDYIKVWFWARNDRTTPLEVKFGLPVVTTSLWVRNRKTASNLCS
ncbi:hypothetical protein C0991_003768 [Blastosporella zonata]|nr:hypothetical protein C0991_003768 [Blastosporella zonata]